MSSDLKKEVNIREKIALYIAFDAGSIILDLYHKKIKKSQKSVEDYVSQIDQDIEQLARKTIFESFPDDSFFGEETTQVLKNGDFEWIIDPIDGTNNYLRGLPLAGVQIAIKYKNDIVYGLVYRPMTQDYYTAKKGEGAYYYNKLTGESKKISVSERGLAKSFGIFDARVGKKDNPATVIFNKIINKISMPRVFGVAAYDIPAVAEGSVEFLLTGIAKKYDIAPGWLLVEEAGGKIYSPTGKAQLNDELMLISNSKIQKELLEAING